MCLPLLPTSFHGEMTSSVWKVDLGESVNSNAGLMTPTSA